MRGDAAQKVNRAYGTTGIITALEMPTAPAWKWIDVVVVFDDFMEAAAVGYEAALADGVVKKLLAPVTWPLPSYFGALRPYCPDGKSILIAMIAEPSLGKLQVPAGAGAARSRWNPRPRMAPARSRSMNTPGTTPRYRC